MAVWDGLQKAMGVGFNERLKPTQTDAASDLTSTGRVFNYTTSVKSSKLSSNPPSTSKCRSNPPSIKSSSFATLARHPGQHPRPIHKSEETPWSIQARCHDRD